MWLAQIPELPIPPSTTIIGNSIINWIVVALVGCLVWLVKRLTDNNQRILDTMRDESEKERSLHREDMKALLEDSQENRKTTDIGFKDLAAAITRLSEKIRMG